MGGFMVEKKKGKKITKSKTKLERKKTTKKVERKTHLKEEKKKKKTFKEIISSVPFLVGVIVCLLLLIAFLGLLIYQKEQKKKEEFDAHITIPVLKVNSNFEFGVDASLLLKEDNQEYIFKIVNYRNEDMATVEVPYTILVSNSTNAVVSLTKGEEETDLMVEQEKTEIQETMPLSEEQEEFYYHLKIESHGKLKTNDFIMIQIVS